MDKTHDLFCLHCGSRRFWRVPAKSRFTTPQSDLFDVLLGRAGELLKDSWVDLLVCRGCGVAIARVADMERFSRVAAMPESGVVAIDFPAREGPYR